jgi:hypothetical protein
MPRRHCPVRFQMSDNLRRCDRCRIPDPSRSAHSRRRRARRTRSTGFVRAAAHSFLANRPPQPGSSSDKRRTMSGSGRRARNAANTPPDRLISGQFCRNRRPGRSNPTSARAKHAAKPRTTATPAKSRQGRGDMNRSGSRRLNGFITAIPQKSMCSSQAARAVAYRPVRSAGHAV